MVSLLSKRGRETHDSNDIQLVVPGMSRTGRIVRRISEAA
jgi:hypothetical protein